MENSFSHESWLLRIFNNTIWINKRANDISEFYK